jgi:hypothetical protein
VLHDLERLDSITRSRRRIQNELHLFEPTAWTKAQRQENQSDFLEYLSYRRTGDPELRFYLDETGSHDGEFVGVGGVCVIDWPAFEPHHMSMQEWRRRQAWPDRLHFAELHDGDIGKYVALLRQVLGRKAALLFVAHGLPAHAAKHETLFCLFTHLVLDSLDEVAALGCLERPRAVRVIKERDTGFDRKKLDRLREMLGHEVVHRFPERAYLRSVDAVPKSDDVLLECADLIASAVRRRLLHDGGHAKDVLAGVVMDETGLAYAPNSGTVFRIHGLGGQRGASHPPISTSSRRSCARKAWASASPQVRHEPYAFTALSRSSSTRASSATVRRSRSKMSSGAGCWPKRGMRSG